MSAEWIYSSIDLAHTTKSPIKTISMFTVPIKNSRRENIEPRRCAWQSGRPKGSRKTFRNVFQTGAKDGLTMETHIMETHDMRLYMRDWRGPGWIARQGGAGK